MRRLPEERLGEKAKMWLAAGGAHSCVTSDLGAKKNCGGQLPDVFYHSGEHCATGRIPRLEALRRDRFVPITGAPSGSNLSTRKRIEIGKEQCAGLS
jgi:hypothetical protein